MKGQFKKRAKISLAAAIATIGFSALQVHATVTLQWDPNSAPGLQGGFGTWNTSNKNWNDNGNPVVWFNSHNDIAAFGGTIGGNIQLTSAITAWIVQFDTPGYFLGPTPSNILTLNSGSVIANVDATIAAPLSTPGGLFKTGAGVLTLSGDNAIHGTLAVFDGTLAIGADADLGGTANDVELSGGGLRYSGAASMTLTSGHAVIVDAAGGRIETPSGTLLLGKAGQLSGPGTLIKAGAKTLQINGVNANFSGAVNVTSGTLLLQNAMSIDGRPVTLSGGTFAMRNDQPADYLSALTVTADSTVTVDCNDAAVGMIGQSNALGDVLVAPGATLTVGSGTRNFIRVNNLALNGTLHLNSSAVMVRGAFAGAGGIGMSAIGQSPENFASGLIFANGVSQTISNAFSADAAGPVVGVDAGTTLNYNGVWSGGHENARSAVVMRDGAKFTVGSAAHLNTLSADLTALRPFIVIGNGASNTFELDPAFIADRTAGGTIADGLGGLEIRDALLVSRSIASLPIVTKSDGFGGKHRAGSLTFSGTIGARWQIAGVDQQYDGGVTINSSATIQTDKNLTHNGTVKNKFDASFQIPLPGVTLAKEGAGTLTLSGDQGYAPGSKLQVNAGVVRFDTDPGAGWFAGNFARGEDGNISGAPSPEGTLAVIVGGASTVEFAAPVSRIDSIQVNAGGVARLMSGAHPGERTLLAHALSAAGNGQFDLTNGQAIIDYTGPNSPLTSIASLIKQNRLVGSGAIGAAEAADLLRINGNQTGVFRGETVDSTSLLIRSTLAGDANLDGQVNFADFQRLELGFGLLNQGWGKGDFNYDGLVNNADFQLFYGNMGKSMPSAAFSPDSVPEPSVLPVLGTLLFIRRRGKAKLE